MTTPHSYPKICPVILSGGGGTRLWPVSRRQYPKQFAHLVDGVPLFNATLARVSDRSLYTAPVIIGNVEHKFFILEALDALNITDATILLEPSARNTSAAAVVSAIYSNERDPGILQLVMPSDHMVKDEKKFHEAIISAAQTARADKLVLFGITPDYPETGYGYIMPGKAIAENAVYDIDMFLEKPDENKAAGLIQKGALWNSGIFLYATDILCKEAEMLAPGHYQTCREAAMKAKTDAYGQCVLLDKDAYDTLESHPFDTLIMENTKRGAVLPCSMGWNDIGSWRSLLQIAEKDGDGNALIGSVIVRNVKNSYLRSEGPTIAALGIEGLAVVATKDAIMVTPCAKAQEVKELLAMVEDAHNPVAISHTCIPRPWGTYENLASENNFLVKHIVVRPGRSLSLQMHHHRAEHWIVVSGTAKVECNDVEKLLFPNESIFIPHGATHRLSNPGKIDLQLIEVQSGEFLDESDIIRFDDMYGRHQEDAKDILEMDIRETEQFKDMTPEYNS